MWRVAWRYPQCVSVGPFASQDARRVWRTRPPLLGKALVPPRWCAGGCVTRRGQDPAFIRRLGASSGARGRQGWTAAVSLLCRPGGARGAGARPSTGLRVRGHEGPLRTFAGVASRPLRRLRKGSQPNSAGPHPISRGLKGRPSGVPRKGRRLFSAAASAPEPHWPHRGPGCPPCPPA